MHQPARRPISGGVLSFTVERRTPARGHAVLSNRRVYTSVMTSERCMDGTGTTRRTFLLGTAALVLSGCRREPDEAPTRMAPDVQSEAIIPLPEPDPEIRVRIRRVFDREKVVVGAEGDWVRIRASAENGTDEVRSTGETSLRGPVTVALAAGGWEVVDGQGSHTAIGQQFGSGRAPLVFDVTSQAEGAGTELAVDAGRYPGFVRLIAHDVERGGGFNVINHVALERYLPGVLARELYGHWDIATYAAQAVAARSFACAEMFQRRTRDYDVIAGQISQAYQGVTDRPQAWDAVEATRGQVLYWQGGLVPGYYSSNCGGTAARAVDAIGPHPINQVGPLCGRSGPDHCTGTPRYRWTATRTVKNVNQSVADWLAARGRADSFNAVRSIEIAHVNVHGRPVRFRLIDKSKNHLELRAEDFRRLINRGAGRDQLYSSDVRVRIDKANVEFHGRGYGHGVGLCQYGAQEMAKQGAHPDDILTWYYPGIEILTAYS